MCIATIFEGNWAILTAVNPNGFECDEETNNARNERLREYLKLLDIPFDELIVAEDSIAYEAYLVPNLQADSALLVAERFGQESVITHRGIVGWDSPTRRLHRVDIHNTEEEAHARDSYAYHCATDTYFTLVFEGQEILGIKLDWEIVPANIDKHPSFASFCDECGSPYKEGKISCNCQF